MRAILLLGLAFVIGCGVSQATPVATTPASSMVATQPAVEAALANAATGQIAQPSGVTVRLSGCFDQECNGTYTLSQVGENQHYWIYRYNKPLNPAPGRPAGSLTVEANVGKERTPHGVVAHGGQLPLPPDRIYYFYIKALGQLTGSDSTYGTTMTISP